MADFEALTAAEDVEYTTRQMAARVDEYIDANCPNAIHSGDWHVTAQILGVGLVSDAIEPQANIYEPAVVWPQQASELTETATSTFDVLAVSTMCAEALRQTELEAGETNAFTSLLPRGVRAVSGGACCRRGS